jgi:hypothetical protein
VTARNYWPTREQELLLRAALGSAAETAAAWAAVRPRLDLDGLDLASQRILPLVYRNLSAHGIDDPWLPRLKGLYRHTWSRNRLLFHHASPLLEELGEAGIATMVLKGGALVPRYYGNDAGCRFMADFDIAVPTRAATEAIAVLERRGWTSAYPVDAGFLRVKHAALFRDAGGRSCDLHWHVFEECCQPDADDDLWQAAVELDIEGRQTRGLSPTDQLLHVCVHGLKWTPEGGVRWVADAMLVLRGAAIDWPRIVEQAVRRRYVLRLRETLGYLRERMGAPIPDAAMRELAAHPVSSLERFEGRVLSREHRVLGQFPLYWCHHRRHANAGPLADALTFPHYLRHAWGLGSLRQIPLGILARGWRRMRRCFGTADPTAQPAP